VWPAVTTLLLLVATSACAYLPPADAQTPAARPTNTGGTYVSGAPRTPVSGAPRTPAPPTAAPAARDAAGALAALTVKGRAPKTGYTRDQFGPAWADVDRDGCDQRNQVLARDLTAPRFKNAGRPCVVLSGTLRSAYTGKTVPFRRGPETSDDVQIDHVVALSDAWQTGAQALDAATRARLANDPLNLQAVEGPVNQGKGDSDAASWLPPANAYRCTYVARQVAVKTTYRLWVLPAEKDAMARVLATCPGQPLPASPLR
jgi:Protein of unknown function (DUF1524)